LSNKTCKNCLKWKPIMSHKNNKHMTNSDNLTVGHCSLSLSLKKEELPDIIKKEARIQRKMYPSYDHLLDKKEYRPYAIVVPENFKCKKFTKED